MINVYSLTAPADRYRATQLKPHGWCYSVAADGNSFAELAADTGIAPRLLGSALDRDERPRIERDGHSTLLVVHVPCDDPAVKQLDQDVKYRTVALGLVITPTQLITVCRAGSWAQGDALTALVSSAPEASLDVLALTLLKRIAREFADQSSVIEQHIATTEDELSRSYRNEELYTLLYLNESLLYLATSLKKMVQVLRRAEVPGQLGVSDAGERLFGQMMVELEQVQAATEIIQLNLNNVMDAYGNVIQNNISHVVKLLTAATIVLSIPTLIASIYGMNVPLPFQEADHAFSALIALMVGSSAAAIYLFRKKRYL
ncbi:magnesium transporter CorA family protein [Isoalcanivorax beigongshangi]|uniref:Magnesium transporter CorA family protein n=1 Tax=Isoalcanivorax beigongshangi TaxID=3238810 RepID=A0ABV4AFC2_9GAMM